MVGPQRNQPECRSKLFKIASASPMHTFLLLIVAVHFLYVNLQTAQDRILTLPTAGRYRRTAHVTHCGRSTVSATKMPQLGTIDRVGKNAHDHWRLRMMLSTSQFEVQPRTNDWKELVTGCLALRASLEWPLKWCFVRPVKLVAHPHSVRLTALLQHW